MAENKFPVGLARAAAGSLLFSLPMILTLEMWSMGFTMDPLRTAILLTVMLPILIALAFYSGFENRVRLLGATVDAFVAYAVGAIVCGIVLSALAVLSFSQAPNEIVGRLVLQTIVASFGAVLAASQMGGDAAADAEQTSETQDCEAKDQPVTNQIQSCSNSDNSLSGYAREMFLCWPELSFWP